MLRKKGKVSFSAQLVISDKKWVMAMKNSESGGNDKHAIN